MLINFLTILTYYQKRKNRGKRLLKMSIILKDLLTRQNLMKFDFAQSVTYSCPFT